MQVGLNDISFSRAAPSPRFVHNLKVLEFGSNIKNEHFVELILFMSYIAVEID
jgi:hypothetical protein